MNTTTQPHGVKTSYMDKTTSPGTDFFRFANGAWVDNTQIPDEYSSWGSFNVLRDENLAQLLALLEEAAANTGATPGSNAQKIGAFYFAGMNEKKIEAEGAKPLASEFARISAIRSRRQLGNAIARLHNYGVNVMFGFGSGQDYADSTQVIAQAVQAGLSLPDRDYYLKDDDKSKEQRAKYVTHVTNMFKLLGFSASYAANAAAVVLKIETELAKVSRSRSERRDPTKNYNKMSVADFAALAPRLPIAQYLKRMGCDKVAAINVGQPDFFKGLDALMGTVTMTEWKIYFRWHLISATASMLSSDFVKEKFDFYGRTLTGSKALLPRWKRIVSATNGSLGEAVGELYVAKHFPPAAKARMLEMVGNLKEALRDSIKTRPWMSEETRVQALAKLDSFVTKIGYPDVWQDYSALRITRNSYVWNVLRAHVFENKLDLAKIGKPVDRNQWLMTPQTINAYYMPPMNEIVFPAAILQPPFFALDADDAANYGAIGAVIGHEMTHGFDDKGSQFDAQGNLRNWWTDADRAAFDSRIKLIKALYGSFSVSGDKHLLPDLVSGEAAADLGGVKLAYLALQKSLETKPRTTDANGFTDEQRFFLAFAQIWATKARDEYEQMQVTTDPHPPGRFRVNGTVCNLPEFAKAFGLADDAPIMLPAEKRADLW